MNNPVYFTRAKQEETLWIEKKKEDKQTISGVEARDFYQSLLQERDRERPRDGEAAASRRAKRRTEPNRRRREARRLEASTVQPVCTERDGHKLLQCAQEGNIRALKDLLRRGCDVNFRDDFFWTGVMCASQAGQTEAVRLLLEHGAAWVGVVDKQGRDARDLALQAGHQDVVRELEQFNVPETTNTSITNNADRLDDLVCRCPNIVHF
ncbi:G patch domain and ankyrin repeat-containing protein 1 isoform b [Danio rerio]|uniref:G patch domain and ankyrin repeat-containing protein 1 isoform b n=1 Tax=Danio rerio TaxID=7955 RepID=F1QN91_DANRE|nr:G patch domain and ankyrin repeat-containing protein 1 isoform b [Danio rerio]|eukprot:NP_001099173.2 G patch domain and ankyrin repeat-containing protein 1 isoform b [Danio rerio]